jgi:biotin carboxyl carrier protein
MIYTYQYNGQSYAVNLEPQPDGNFAATIGNRSYTVHVMPLSDGGWRLQFQPSPPAPLPSGEGRKSYTLYTAAKSDQRFVSFGGQDYALTVPDKRASRRRASAGGGDLTAQMPGQVVNVLVNEGDTVERGQTLVILEAMKMEIRVAAPGDGRVKRLLVEKGQVVERGQLLLEIEETS